MKSIRHSFIATRPSFARLARAVLLTGLSLWASTTAHAALDPTDYPQQDFLLIGTVPATIEPRRAARFNAPMNGSIEIMLEARQGTAKEDTLLAWMDRERLELEGEVLALEATNSRVRQIPEKQLASLQQRHQLETRSSEIDQQLNFLSEIERKPELARLFTEDSEGFQLDKAATAEQLENEQALAETLLEALQTPENEALAQELAERKLAQRQLDYEKRLRDSQIRMPFDGHYQLMLPTEPGRTVYSVLQGDPILLTEDRSEIFGIVEVKGNHWRLLPRERLRLNFPGAGALSPEETGRFAHSVLDDSGRRPTLFYHFKFDAENLSRVERLRGGVITAELLLDLRDEPAHMIPKADLINAFPNAFAEGWESGIRQHIEGVRAIHVGQTAIALVLGD